MAFHRDETPRLDPIGGPIKDTHADEVSRAREGPNVYAANPINRETRETGQTGCSYSIQRSIQRLMGGEHLPNFLIVRRFRFCVFPGHLSSCEFLAAPDRTAFFALACDDAGPGASVNLCPSRRRELSFGWPGASP